MKTGKPENTPVLLSSEGQKKSIRWMRIKNCPAFRKTEAKARGIIFTCYILPQDYKAPGKGNRAARRILSSIRQPDGTLPAGWHFRLGQMLTDRICNFYRTGKKTA